MSVPSLEKVLQAFEAKSASGKYRYPLEQIKDALAVLLLRLSPQLSLEKLPPEFHQVVGELAVKLAQEYPAEPFKLDEALKLYLANHPPHTRLVAELRQVLGVA